MRVDVRLTRNVLRRGRTGVAALGVGAALTLGAAYAPDGRDEPEADASLEVGTGHPSLPAPFNERVAHWRERFQTVERATFERYLERRGLYERMIREKLRARGMPEELIYLAMIESGFAPDAVSPVAATGLWQFMAETARAEGLRIDTWVDERRDPILATDAALDYLQGLHDRFGSWTLAAAAYNAGPTRVARILRRQDLDDRSDEGVYWDVIDALPRETRDYVPKLLAARMLAESPETYGFEVSRAPAYAFEPVMVPGGTWLTTVARSLGVSPRVMRELNPQLLRGRTPPGSAYPVRVPVGGTPLVLAYLNDTESVDPAAD